MRRLITIAMTCLMGTGCGAGYWGGQDSGETPGMRVQSGLTGRSIEFTGNTNVSLENLNWSGEKGKSNLDVQGLNYGLNVSEVVTAQVPKIDAIGRLQLTQVEYAKIVYPAIVDALKSTLGPFLGLLAAGNFQQTSDGLQLTLPGGFAIGKTNTSAPPAEIMAEAANLMRILKPVTSDTPVEIPGPPAVVIPSTAPAAVANTPTP